MPQKLAKNKKMAKMPHIIVAEKRLSPYQVRWENQRAGGLLVISA